MGFLLFIYFPTEYCTSPNATYLLTSWPILDTTVRHRLHSLHCTERIPTVIAAAYIVTFKDDTTEEEIERHIEQLEQDGGVVTQRYTIIKVCNSS